MDLFVLLIQMNVQVVIERKAFPHVPPLRRTDAGLISVTFEPGGRTRKEARSPLCITVSLVCVVSAHMLTKRHLTAKGNQ